MARPNRMPAPGTRWSSLGFGRPCPASRPTAAWSERHRRKSLSWSPPTSNRPHRQRSGRRPLRVPWRRAEGQRQSRSGTIRRIAPIPCLPPTPPERETIVSQGQPSSVCDVAMPLLPLPRRPQAVSAPQRNRVALCRIDPPRRRMSTYSEYCCEPPEALPPLTAIRDTAILPQIPQGLG